MAQEVQHHAGSLAMPQFDLAEDTSFLQNVARYGKYFVTVSTEAGSVGTGVSFHIKLRTRRSWDILQKCAPQLGLV